MTWVVRFAAAFEAEFTALSEAVRLELLAQAKVLEHFGPQAGRPRVDTLKGSKHALIAKADSRFDAHLEKLPKKPGTEAKAKAGLRRRK